MSNRQCVFQVIVGRELRWREILFWTLLLAAFQSLESTEWRRQMMGVVETIVFLYVAISSAGKLDGLGLEFTCWHPIGLRAATASVATGLVAGGIVVMVALCCHQPLGADTGWQWVVLAVVLGPVVEEVVFRGYFMTAALQFERRFFRTQRGWASIIAVAVIFMFAHGARPGTAWIQRCCIVVTGTVYGVVRLRQQSTVAAVLAHSCYNLALYMSYWIGLST